jgi:hypothetical protein
VTPQWHWGVTCKRPPLHPTVGCASSSAAKPLEFSPPARAAAAKARLEELKKPKSGASASRQAAVDPRLQHDNRSALGTSSTPAVKKYALTEDFYKPHTPSARACESNTPLC